MKNIVLSIIVVTALVVAGIGGTLATWSDAEVSKNNEVSTGSLDLKVNGADDAPWGTGVPVKVEVECVVPEKFYGPYEVELWNAGQCQFPSHAFIHLTDFECSNILPKANPYPDGGSAMWPAGATTGYACPVTGELKPEPELVAEFGGMIGGGIVVPGVGIMGDECSMGSHVELICTADMVPPNDPDADIIFRNLIEKLYCQEIYLFDLMPCEPRTIYLWIYVRQDAEEDYGYNLVPNPGEVGYDALFHDKFNDWPSAAIMKDKIEFDLTFDLWLEDSPGGVVNP